MKSRFVAVTEVSPGAQYAIAESPLFKWRSAEESEPPEDVAAAHQLLVDQLIEAGWEATGVEDNWFEQSFSRRKES